MAAGIVCFGHYWNWEWSHYYCVLLCNALSACIKNRFRLSK